MALIAPMLGLIGLGSAELGRYFHNQHVIVKAVRGGAIFASRQPIEKFNCTTRVVDATVVSSTTALIKTGALANGSNLLPNASNNSASYDFAVDCVTSADSTTLSGVSTLPTAAGCPS